MWKYFCNICLSPHHSKTTYKSDLVKYGISIAWNYVKDIKNINFPQVIDKRDGVQVTACTN